MYVKGKQNVGSVPMIAEKGALPVERKRSRSNSWMFDYRQKIEPVHIGNHIMKII